MNGHITSTRQIKKNKSLDYATLFSEKPKDYNTSNDTKQKDSDKKKPCTFTKSINVHTNKVHIVNWSCDGGYLGSGSVDRTAAISKLKQGSTQVYKVATCKGHTSHVDQIAFSPIHPDIFATAALDKTVRIWDARVKNCLASNTIISTELDSKNDSDKLNDKKDVKDLVAKHKIDTKGENINLTWSPNGEHLCVGNKEDTLCFIDMNGHPKIAKSHDFKFEVNEFSWNKSGEIFTITTGSGSIQNYDFKTLINLPSQEANIENIQPAFIENLQGHSGNCLCLEYDPTGKYFAVGSTDVLVSLWDAVDYTPIRIYSELSWPVRQLGFSHDGRLIAAASEDHFIDISLVEALPGQISWDGEKYIDRFQMGLSEHGAEFTLHSPKYLANRRTSSSLYKVETGLSEPFSVAWHPTRTLLAFSCDESEKERRDRKDKESNTGNIRLFGIDES